LRREFRVARHAAQPRRSRHPNKSAELCRRAVESRSRVRHYTSRLYSTAAPMKDENSGCGAKGRDFSSGWNCTPMNAGWSLGSMIYRPSADPG
jgi:hypothetical protein